MTYIIAKLGIALLVTAFCGAFLRADMLFVFGVIALFCGICLRVFSQKYSDICAICIAATLGFCLAGANLVINYYPANNLNGKTAELSGIVTEVSAAGGNPVYTVKTDFIDIEGTPQNLTVKLSGWEDFSAKPYDKITCKASFAVYGGENFEEILSNRSRKIAVYAYTKTPMEVVGEAHSGLGYAVYCVREAISEVIYSYFIDWHAPFMDELLIGNKGELETYITEPFRKSGMSHILAISGMHMAIIIGILERTIAKIGRGKPGAQKVKIAVLILSTAAYMFIGGLGASVLRAGFMLIASYITKLFFCGSKSLDNLGCAIIAMVILDPAAAYDIGFLLSVFACFGIAVFAEPLKNYVIKLLHIKKNKFLEIAAESLAASTVASLAVLPISAIVFGNISTVAPFANLFAAVFAKYSLVFGVLTVVLGSIPVLNFFAGGIAVAAMACNGAMLKIARIFSSLPFAYIGAEENWVIIWIIGSAFLFIMPWVVAKNFKYIKFSALMSVFLLLAGILTNIIFFNDVLAVNVTALKEGTAVEFCQNGKSVTVTHGLCEGDEYNFSGKTGDLISVSSKSSSAEMALVQKLNSQNAFLTYEDAAARSKNANELAFGKVEIFKEGYINVISDGIFTAKLDEFTLLYISEEYDIMKLEPKFRRADIVIFDGITPSNFPDIRTQYLVFRKQSGYFDGSTEIITLKNGTQSFFAYDETVKKGGFAK